MTAPCGGFGNFLGERASMLRLHRGSAGSTPFVALAGAAAVLLAVFVDPATSAELPHYHLSVVEGIGGVTSAAAVNDGGWITGHATRNGGGGYHSGDAFVSHEDMARGLETPGRGHSSNATGINAGNVAIVNELEGTFGQVSTAVMFSPQGKRTALPPLAASTPNARAYAINDAGTIVGESTLQEGSDLHRRAVVWSGGGIADAGAALGGSSFASAINANGDFVGDWYADDSSTITTSVIWIDGVAHLFQPLGVQSSTAVGINAGRTVVGVYYVDSGGTSLTFGYAWNAGASIHLDPLPGGVLSRPSAIDDAGLIVGYSEDAKFQPHAVLWLNGVAHDLNELVVDMPPGFVLSTAVAISPSGLIVGTVEGKGPLQSFLLTPLD